MARTTVIAGTATAVSRGVSGAMDSSAQQRAAQEQQRAAQEQQRIDMAVQHALAQQQVPPPAAAPAPPPAAETSDSRIAKLQQLAELKRQGILSDEEFAAEKERILAA
jgi:hypothetical protein